MSKENVTVYDIAKAAKVSTSTVSRVLNHPEQVQYHTKQRIYEIIKQLGFNKRSYCRDSDAIYPDIHLKSFLICLPTFQNSFYGDIIEGANSAINNHGCNLFVDTFLISELNVDAFLFMIKQHHISGLILMAAIADSLLERINKTIPVVQCSEYNEMYSGISVISINDEEAEEKATNYAISTGHLKIAFMTSSFQYHYSVRRMRGFMAAIEQASLQLPDEWIIQLPRVDYSLAYDAAINLLNSPNRPNAIIAASDIYAAACINAATSINIRVPEELNIIGFDNIDIATSTYPSITTINQPRFQLGYTAFEVLLNELENSHAKKQRLFLPTELIIRESTTIGSPD